VIVQVPAFVSLRNKLCTFLGLAVLLLSPTTSFAKGLQSKTVEKGSETQYEAKWQVGKAKLAVSAPLPTSALEADLKAPLRFPRAAAQEAQVEAVRSWANVSLPKSTDLKVKAKNGGIQYAVRAKSRSAAKDALEGAEKVGRQALVSFAKEKGFIVDPGNVILPDHPREVSESAPALGALAAALAKDLKSDDPRAFADKALHFAQSIPYEKRPNGGDAGFRRPLSLLAKNKGDCDGKTVLFLALVRAQYPDLAMGVVLVPEHAFAAVALSPKPGERTIKEGGVTYVIMEPVGPAQTKIGKPSKAAKKGLRFGRSELRPVPFGQK